ncbi:unnamed protein product [marine sediment metagenome]|uniref:VRR-NUC domain-containing protein n=1 Tax=marine sediment metagenome TaxID=412755 RepID=X1C366_9ZZZZ
MSDIISCHRGYFCVIEIKIGKDTPTPLQKVFQRKSCKAGGFAAVCWSLEEVKLFIKKVDQVLDNRILFDNIPVGNTLVDKAVDENIPGAKTLDNS